MTRVLFGLTPQQGPSTPLEFGGIEWFGEVIIGPTQKKAPKPFGCEFSGKHHRPRACPHSLVRLNSREHLRAAQSRKVHIQDHQVECVLLKQRPCLLAILRLDAFAAAEHGNDQLAERRIILDDQHPRCGRLLRSGGVLPTDPLSEPRERCRHRASGLVALSRIGVRHPRNEFREFIRKFWTQLRDVDRPRVRRTERSCSMLPVSGKGSCPVRAQYSVAPRLNRSARLSTV